MIDITTVNPNKIPPEIEVLENENINLLQHNEELVQYSKVISVIVITLVIGVIIATSLKKKKNEKEKLA